MRDDEILKALDSVGTATGVVLGPHSGQTDIIADRFRELIDENSHQKAEIERLEKKANTPFAKVTFDENKLKKIVADAIGNIEFNLNSVKSEAIKEFAEEIEYFVLNEDIEVVEPKCKDYESYINGANQFRHQIKNGINNLIKEMPEVSE